ncbi:hypothetical protein PHYBOEH_007983 [Phytophthora boehmeriae]|uniref:Mitochondrial cardiolipin hydrolase n=1 Tax=Phytophthora boehmeriae TaxID=109152 RepID=A0A8T1W2W3_9STRA|nr:hypothetical protein PHYBOEH_007983 [Phytophthora boehmeriae]
MTKRGKTLRQEEVPGLLELLRKHQRHIKKWDRWAPDFPLVARLSHRGTSLLRRVWDECQDGSPLQPPKKAGPAQRPEHTPEALAGKLMWLTPEQIASTAYTLRVVDMKPTTYRLLKPKAMELLRRIPQTRFHKADSDQQSRMLDHIRAASPGDCICVAQYAFTLKSFSDTLIERKCAGVEVLVLVDLTWLKAHCEALDVLCDLQAAGIEVKHLGDTSMNLTLLVVGGAYAAGGSASLTDAAFASNADLVTEVQGYSEGVASVKELFDEQYNCHEARVAQESEITADLESLVAED